MTTSTMPDTEPVILPRDRHCISRKQIDERCLKVLYRLHRSGYKAYLVGGSVRDMLLGRSPKDFDVATDATPEQIKTLFRNCFIVGRRFRLAHIRFSGNYVVEVATFRRNPSPDELPEDPLERRGFVENVFGSPQEDAHRRDLSINGLFYDIGTFSVIDYVGGLKDLENQRLRVIGDPLVRFTEDPVRMLRALEFSARLGFSLAEEVREAIYMRAPLIAEAAPARIREELLELFRHRVAAPVFSQAQATGLLTYLIPGYEKDPLTASLLQATDSLTTQGAAVEEYRVLAVLYFSDFLKSCEACEGDGELHIADTLKIANRILGQHCQYFHIASGIRHQARELFIGFTRLRRGQGRKGEKRFLRHPLTPLILDFYRLWSEAAGEGEELLQIWESALAKAKSAPASSGRTASEEKPEEQSEGQTEGKSPRRRRPRRRGPRKPAPSPEG